MIERSILGLMLVVVLIWFYLTPDAPSRLPWLYALAVAPTVILVSLGSIRERLKPWSYRRRLGRLLELEHGDPADDAIGLEVERLFLKLRQARLDAAIGESQDFVMAAARSGPHQVASLRLALHHPERDEEPWCSLLRTHAGVLRASELESWEEGWLDELIDQS